MKRGDNIWSGEELELLSKLSTIEKIQEFIDSVPYSSDGLTRTPKGVIRDREAHCFDGAMFAAAALKRLGFSPRLINLRAVRDDDHVIALIGKSGAYGALAKSNFVTLRFREPVYKTVRELVMSYFDFYYNVEGEKTLRAYSVPLNLDRLKGIDWISDERAYEPITVALDESRHYELLSPGAEEALAKVDERTYKAGMLGINTAGLYIPEKTK